MTGDTTEGRVAEVTEIIATTTTTATAAATIAAAAAAQTEDDSTAAAGRGVGVLAATATMAAAADDVADRRAAADHVREKSPQKSAGRCREGATRGAAAGTRIGRALLLPLRRWHFVMGYGGESDLPDDLKQRLGH